MELRQLRYFVALSELLHFGRAAASLGIAQPTLSEQIRRLESQLQTTLMDRTTRQVQLTQPGRVFLVEAIAIVRRADRAAVAARRATHGEGTWLVVGFGPWTGFEALLAAVRFFRNGYPGVQLELRTMSSQAQIAALADERIDIGILRPPVSEPSLRSELLLREPFVVAVPRDHRLAGSRSVRLSALADEPFVLFPRDLAPYFHDTMLTLCNEAGFVPQVHHDADHPRTILSLVAAGLGISLVPASMRTVASPGVVFRSLYRSSPVLHTTAAWRRESTSPIVKAFVATTLEAMAGSRKGSALRRGRATVHHRPSK